MRYLIIVSLVFLFLSCDDDPEPADGVNLRIQNQSGLIFDEVYVGSSRDDHTFGELLPGMKSDYARFDILYRYAYIRIQSGTREYILQPIDFVGEQPLAAGNYRYILSIEDTDDKYSVRLEFREE
jgi:hypothetical protein